MRLALDQQLVLDTSAGTAVNGTIPEDTGPTNSSPGMYAGRSFWMMAVGAIAHNITATPPINSVQPSTANKASGTPTTATTAMGLVPITNGLIGPFEIPAGTIISAITQGGAATTSAKVSFFRCYP